MQKKHLKVYKDKYKRHRSVAKRLIQKLTNSIRKLEMLVMTVKSQGMTLDF